MSAPIDFFKVEESNLDIFLPIVEADDGSDIGRKFLVPREDTVKPDKFKPKNFPVVVKHPESSTAVFRSQDYYPNGNASTLAQTSGDIEIPDPNGQEQPPSIEDMESRSDSLHPEYKWKFDFPMDSGISFPVYQNPSDSSWMIVKTNGQRRFNKDLMDLLKPFMRSGSMSNYIQHMDSFGPWIN